MNKEEQEKILEVIRIYLAEYAYDTWSGWIEYLFTMGKMNKSGTFTINKKSVAKWKRQMNLSFTELSEEERADEFEEADKIIDIQRKIFKRYNP